MPTDRTSANALYYKTATISRLTGYSPLVLRAWERRYGLLRPLRATGGHRLYTEDDLTVLRVVREMTSRGMSIGEVAALGRAALTAPGAEEALTRRAQARQALPSPLQGVRDLSELRASLIRAATILDEAAVRAALDEGFKRLGEERVVSALVCPVMQMVGAMWESGRLSVAAEHLVSQVVRQRILTRIETHSPPRRPPRDLVVCACAGDEQHDLGALTLVLALSRAGFPTLYLGPRIPIDDVDAACALRTPLSTCLSFKQPELLESMRARLRCLAAAHVETRFLIGGDGVRRTDPQAPDNLTYLVGASLDDALRAVLETAASGA